MLSNYLRNTTLAALPACSIPTSILPLRMMLRIRVEQSADHALISVDSSASIVGSQQRAELFDSEAGVADNTAHRNRVHRIVPGDSENARTIAHHYVLSLSQDDEPGLLKSTYGVKVIDSGNLGQGYAVISTTRTSSPRNCSSTTAKYSTIATRMFSKASASVAPCDQHPGSPGTDAATP